MPESIILSKHAVGGQGGERSLQPELSEAVRRRDLARSWTEEKGSKSEDWGLVTGP